MAGDPGIGKTWLLRELAALADERGHLVLEGTAAEFERELAYSVWIDALDAYVASQEPAFEPDLAPLLPSLRRGGDDVDGLADERFRVHRAARTLLDGLGGRHGLVLVLDDLHWSDDASLELLAAVLRRGVGDRVLLALAYRPGQAPQRLVTALATAATERLELRPLSAGEASALLPDREAAEREALYRASGGNPFYLEQLARAPGAVAALGDGAGPGQIPAAVAGALGEELGLLAADSRRLLQGAAVAGEPFDPDLAGAVAELDRGRALDALDDLMERDLVRLTSVPRRFQFRHPLVRRAVYDGTPGGWRIAAHGRAAEFLAGRGAPAVECARHVEHAATPGDPEAVALLARAGAESAGRAPSSAARWYEAALRLLRADDIGGQVQLRRRLASALRAAGELERCRAVLLEALARLPEDAGTAWAEIVARCAATEHWLGRHDEAHTRLQRAWSALPDSVSAEGAMLQHELAVDALYAVDYQRAEARAAGALKTARAVGHEPLVATSASVLALAEAAQGRVAEALEHRAQSLAVLDRLSDVELGPHHEAFYYLAWAENYLERFADAEAHADRGIAIARAVGSGRILVPLMLAKPYAFEMVGRMPEALELCQAALEATELTANPHYRFWALFELGWARYYAGDPEGAIEACTRSAELGRLGGSTIPSAGGGPGWALATSYIAVGRPERAEQMIDDVGGRDLQHTVPPVERCFDWEIRASAALALGRLEDAEDHARQAEAQAAGLGLRLPEAVACRIRASVLMHGGRHAEAAAMARASIAAAEAVGARLQAAFSRALLGECLAEAGDRAGAIAALRRAERELDECRSIRPRDAARRELRKLGARAEPRGPATAADSGVAALTKREREIADLVTERKTNRQIAAALYLSDKTIESHLRNIFAKLGASSRVEVALAVDRHRREEQQQPA